MSSSSIASSTISSTVTNLINNMSGDVTVKDHSKPSEPIFLQTKLAQGVAGIFVWAALFLTCTQVIYNTHIIFINAIIMQSFTDLPSFKMVHESNRTKMDCKNSIYCTNVCNIFMD